MKAMSKLLVLLLALVMIFTMIPAVARAEEVPAETGTITAHMPFRINPLYEGQIREEDLVIPEFPEQDPTQIQPNATYYYTVDYCGAQMRSYMKQRAETFTINVQADTPDYNAVADEMLAIAVKHTGKATEGDYLMWQFAGMEADVTRSFNSKTEMYEFTYEFVVPYFTTAAQEQEMNTAVNNLINTLGVRYRTDYEKVTAVYDWLCENVTYDYDNLEDNTYVLKHSAYAALINKTAVCQGYAVLFYRLMLEMNVDNRVIVGYSGEPHAWNIVKLGGLYYNLDATWDAGQAEYSWFLKSFWDFPGHEREMTHDTLAFHNQYPIAAESYEPGKTGTKDPYICAGYMGENIDNAMWLMGRDGTLTVRGTGSTYDFTESTQLPYYKYWENEITKLVVEDGITDLGEYSFCRFPGLKELDISSTVKNLGKYCFGYCTSLQNVTLKEGLVEIGDFAFSDCENLTTISLPSSLKTIGTGAFMYDSALVMTSLPRTLEVLGDRAFDSCSSIKTFTLPSSLKSIGQGVLSHSGLETVTMEEGVETVPAQAFYSCSKLTQVNLPSTLKTIGSEAFRHCTALSAVTLPDGMELIGANAFNQCALSEILIPDTVATIGEGAFSHCTKLATVKLPKNLTEIEAHVFQFCAIQTIDIPASVTQIGKNAFGYTDFVSLTLPEGLRRIEEGAFCNCEKLTELNLPDSLEYFDGFYNCTALTSVVIPEGVTEIGDAALANCENLTSVTLPGSVRVIGDRAFSRCYKLESLVIPEGVTEIPQSMVQFCTALSEVVLPSTVTTISTSAFQNCENLTAIILPEGLKTLGYDSFSGTGLKEIVIPASVTAIDSKAFWGCHSLEKAVVNGYVGISAFEYCTGLKDVELQNTVKGLGMKAFARCQALESMTIPGSVQEIGMYCFQKSSAFKKIIFQGDAPQLGHGMLENLIVTAYYPQDNTTWTESKMQNYGGTVTWVPYGEPTAKFISISASLGGNIAMNFYVEVSDDLLADPEAYVQFTFAGRTVKVPLSEGKHYSGNIYIIPCLITSKNMTDKITAQVYNANGPVGEPKTMALVDYCNWALQAYANDPKTLNLVKAMLNYGAAAQIMFNYRTNDLANAALSEADKVLTAVDASAYKHSVTGTEEGIVPVSITLLLDSETIVRCYFQLTGDKSIEEYTFTVDGVVVTPQYQGGYYYIDKPNIAAHRLDDMHVFTCGDITVTYGALSYVNVVMGLYNEGAIFDVASALFAYSKAAEAYIG